MFVVDVDAQISAVVSKGGNGSNGGAGGNGNGGGRGCLVISGCRLACTVTTGHLTGVTTSASSHSALHDNTTNTINKRLSLSNAPFPATATPSLLDMQLHIWTSRDDITEMGKPSRDANVKRSREVKLFLVAAWQWRASDPPGRPLPRKTTRDGHDKISSMGGVGGGEEWVGGSMLTTCSLPTGTPLHPPIPCCCSIPCQLLVNAPCHYPYQYNLSLLTHHLLNPSFQPTPYSISPLIHPINPPSQPTIQLLPLLVPASYK